MRNTWISGKQRASPKVNQIDSSRRNWLNIQGRYQNLTHPHLPAEGSPSISLHTVRLALPRPCAPRFPPREECLTANLALARFLLCPFIESSLATAVLR